MLCIVLVILPAIYVPSTIPPHPGIVFDDLDDSDNRIEYTLRLRHEVGDSDTWETQSAGPGFEMPGPRVDNK